MTPAVKRTIFTSETNGRRYFIVRTLTRPNGRRYFVCSKADCESRVLRESDLFCRLHSKEQQKENELIDQENSEAIETNDENPQDFDFSTADDREENQQIIEEEFSPETSTSSMSKVTEENLSDGTTRKRRKNFSSTKIGTNRSYRDSSGKIRFLCSISTCRSRVARQADFYCRRHQLEFQSPEKNESNEQKKVEREQNQIEEQQTTTKRIKTESKTKKTNQVVLATTTLGEESWNDVLRFIHHFPDVQLSVNLNVTDSTTHLIVDDHESNLRCTITKKIVQAAVRRQVFIISHRWLNECIENNSFVDERKFEIVSDSHTTLRQSSQNFDETNQFIYPRNSPTLNAFAIECRQCQGSINRTELVELIRLTGADLFHEEQAVDSLIVLCDLNDKNFDKIKQKYAEAPASSIKFVSSDFLLKTIIKFEVQDLEKYAL